MDESCDITVSPLDGDESHHVHLDHIDEDYALGFLRCNDDNPACPGTVHDPAPRESVATGTTLFFVVPASIGRPVVGSTKSWGPGPFPYDQLIRVPGKLPLGTPLFDAKGRPAAVAVLDFGTNGDETLTAPLAPPPKEPEKRPEAREVLP